MTRVHRATLCCIAILMAGCAPTHGPEVVVYVSVDRGQAEPILQSYQQQSGVRIRAVYDAEAAKTTGLVSRLVAESGRPRCDVFWNNELVQTLNLADRGVLDEFRPNASADLSTHYKDDNGRWTAVATRARVIVFNTKYVRREEAPSSLWDLAQPKWRGKCAVANPQFGTTRTHCAALFAELGPEKAQQLLQSWLDNDVRIVDGNAMVKNLVARAHPDASPVYVGLTDTDDVLAGQAEGEPIDMIYPDQASIGTLLIPSTVCLVRGAPHRPEAEGLIEYLVGPQAVGKLTEPGSGYHDVRRKREPSLRAFEIDPATLLEQLEPSSRWTAEHFHP